MHRLWKCRWRSFTVWLCCVVPLRALACPELSLLPPCAQVNQGNMPGIQSTFLAMDTEEGVEVVWNELLFTDKKAFKAHEEKIKTMFEQLVLVDHPNIVKLHKYWLDVKDSKARVIFITEYVSSGSLKQFLKKTKKNHKAMNARAWKRWCTQILSALSFLHSCEPPIIHGNLTSDTIFIQHNGLIKIGSVWHRVFASALPDDLRSPIRIEREELRNLHFFPPEYGQRADGTAVDIFSFGMCALEMAVLEIQTNGDTRVSEEAIARARHSLDDPNMREFILSCLTLNPDKRPTANSLLFHRVLFEVHSLKLLAAHCFINHQYLMPENVVEEKIKELDLNMVMAEIRREGRPGAQWRYSEVSFLELDKFLEDVRNGIYPLMNFAVSRPLALPRALSQPQEESQKAKTPTPEPFDVETRKVRPGRVGTAPPACQIRQEFQIIQQEFQIIQQEFQIIQQEFQTWQEFQIQEEWQSQQELGIPNTGGIRNSKFTRNSKFSRN
uniref:Nuclear receptor binding protein 2 n=1 Tax=Catharus ustulatus TaxID=91951 RepID=A0A8C3TNL7_CATUS